MLLQEELENFPLPTIHLSQTVLNQTRYPSVLLLVCQDNDQHKPDIHFFHCDEVDVSIGSYGLGSFCMIGFVCGVIYKSERLVRFHGCFVCA